MARAIQKLVRNGSSTQITLPRWILVPLGWLPGTDVVVELTENNAILITPLEDPRFKPKNARRVVQDEPAPVNR
jgi:antitoxin component of MazEF toxin-antitoxin module